MPHTVGRTVATLVLVGIGLSGCARADAPRLAIVPVPLQDQTTAKLYQSLTRQQEIVLTACPDGQACGQAHYIRALLALHEDPDLAIRHFRAVIAQDSQSRLAASSRFWLDLLDGTNAGRTASPEQAVSRLVRDLIERELLIQHLAREGAPPLKTLQRELKAKDQQIEDLKRNLEALKRVDLEVKEKARPFMPSGRAKPLLKHEEVP